MKNPDCRTVTVSAGGQPYRVFVGESLLEDCGALITSQTTCRGKCALITDEIVGSLYAEQVVSALEGAGFGVVRIVVPAGEKSKSLQQVESCLDAMIAAGLDRSSFVVALGGGVVGDLAGFVAAIYFRGIPFVQIPTTIVAQVDSAVGGKTGVNARGGKNLIGAFHQPVLVLADASVLGSLPTREFNEGFAEIVKHGVIRSADLLGEICPGRREGLVPLLAENIKIKAEIVGEDEFETKGLRALLNFGHTVGHAIENAAGYGQWFHGEAVSLGMVVALRLSREFAGLSEAEEQRVLALLQDLGLPTDINAIPPTEQILEAMRTDKKFAAGKVRFVLVPRLGEALVSDQVQASDIARVIEALRNKSMFQHQNKAAPM